MATTEISLKLDALRDKVLSALEHAGGHHTLEDVKRMVSDGRLQPWVGNDSLLLTEVAPLPGGAEMLHHFLAAGSLSEIVRLRGEAVAWAREQGIEFEVFTGRPGWERVARRLSDGWGSLNIQMSRRIACQEF